MSEPAALSDPLRPLLRELIHAINSPIGVILGTSQFALSGLEGKGREEVTEEDLKETVESFEMIERQVRACASLVEVMRALVAAGELKLRPTDLRDCLLGAREKVKWEDGGVRLEESVPEKLPPVSGDPEKLTEAFAAIAQNAFEAMPTGGVFRVMARQEGEAIEISLEDDGGGIPAEVLPRIFSPRYSTKSEEGRGPGLAVARLILEAHGAGIDVRSEQDRGTQVVVRFPVSPICLQPEKLGDAP